MGVATAPTSSVTVITQEALDAVVSSMRGNSPMSAAAIPPAASAATINSARALRDGDKPELLVTSSMVRENATDAGYTRIV
ncbi:Uncharacterised protein [Mycobacteroides abscessus subsp. abscessus]|nr:Uncharacterised protein [Mycobacteroides abscessus subsp. abscessus]